MIELWILLICACLLFVGAVWLVLSSKKCKLKPRLVPKPGQPILRDRDRSTTKEDNMSQKYIYRLDLPLPGADDVVSREIHIITNGRENVEFINDPSVLEYEVELREGYHVSIFLIDIDEAGNRSEPGTALNFIVEDSSPPPAPASPIILDKVVVDEGSSS